MMTPAAIRERIDHLELRERVLILLALLGVFYLVWSVPVMGGLETRLARLDDRVDELRREVRGINRQVEIELNERGVDPDAQNRLRLSALRAAKRRLDGTLGTLTERLVPPEMMAEMLESLLESRARLTLVRLEGLGAHPVSVAASAAATGAGEAEAADPALYRHGLRVALRGDYLSTLAYLRALEALPWNFLWGRLEIEVARYPEARISITVYSLSFDEDWIGV